MKNIFQKSIIPILIIAIVIIGTFAIKNSLVNFNLAEAQDSGKYELSGWAWSSSIGWISFNSKNYLGEGDSEHGVNVDKNSGELSGYAWSDNIGWISFNNGDIRVPSFIPPCDGGYGDVDLDGYVTGKDAQLVIDYYMEMENESLSDEQKRRADVSGDGEILPEDHRFILLYINNETSTFPVCEGKPLAPPAKLEDGKISGWARACSVFKGEGCSGDLESNVYRGGWDGWIKFDSTNIAKSNYNVKLIDGENEFKDWARGGDDVVGWVSFNCKNKNTCTKSNYAVSLESSSRASGFEIELDKCNFNNRLGIKNSNGEVEGGMIFKINFDYSGENQGSGLYQLKIEGISSNYQYTTQAYGFPEGGAKGAIIDEGNFFKIDEKNKNEVRLTWGQKYKVTLEIIGDPLSSDEAEIELPDHSYPYVYFSKEQKPSIVDLEYSLDGSSSEVYGGSNPKYKWTESGQGGIFSSGDEATTTISFPEGYEGGHSIITLEVSEEGNPLHSCKMQDSFYLEKKIPLPKYKEISPFVKISRFFSSIYDSLLNFFR